VAIPQIAVNPERVTFPPPAPGQTTVDATVEVKNTGGGILTITGVTLTADDETAEVSILNEAEWGSGSRLIAASSSATLTLRWTVLDEEVDRGSVVLTSNGGEVAIPFETSELRLPAWSARSDE
jgi:hypothetical protein